MTRCWRRCRSVEEAVSTDGELAALRAEASRLRIEAAAADAYADAARRSANLALDFARRETFNVDRRRYNGRDDYLYGYGYDYGYGYSPFIGHSRFIGGRGFQTRGFVGHEFRRATPTITNVVSNP